MDLVDGVAKLDNRSRKLLAKRRKRASAVTAASFDALLEGLVEVSGVEKRLEKKRRQERRREEGEKRGGEKRRKGKKREGRRREE